jgi:uncharacterized lipoprotein
MRARAAALIAPTLAAAAVAGCGVDSTNDEYVQQLNQAQTGLAKRFTQLQARITATSTAAQDRRTLQQYEAAVATTVTDLRKIDPPQGFDRLHREFVGEVSEYGAALRGARAQLDGDDPRAILAAQGRLRTAVAATGRKIDATISAINRKLKG